MPIIPALETEGPGVQGHPWIISKFEASLDYARLSLKTKKQQKQTNKNKKKTTTLNYSQVWWLMAVTLALGRLRQ